MNCFLCTVTALALAAAAVADGRAKAAPGKPVQPVVSGPVVGKARVGHAGMASEVNLSPKENGEKFPPPAKAFYGCRVGFVS